MTSSMQGCNSQDQYSSDQSENSQQLVDKHFLLNSPPFQNLNSQLQNDLYVLSVLLERNNRIFLELIDMDEKLEQRLKILQRLHKEKKLQEEKSIQLMKKKFQQNIDRHILNLETKLFGFKEYKYQLVLNQPFNKELYKQRNFDISVKIIDADKNIVANQNQIPITLTAYTSDENPCVLFQNKNGQQIFKGNCEGKLYNGVGKLTKLQFREVSSIYCKKWIYFVIYTKPNSFSYIDNENGNVEKIEYSQIRPLILSEVTIKSKKKQQN